MLQELRSPGDATDSLSREGAVDRELLRRIVLSMPFAKSPRLSHFLRYICTEAEEGRQSGINEQRIGSAVFGRDPDYDSAIDSIVRSHASRLRLRLREYFETEGLHEPVILTVPKGSYVPRFESRVLQPLRETEEEAGDTPQVEPAQLIAAPYPQTVPFTQNDAHEDRQAAVSINNSSRWRIAFTVAATIAVALAITLGAHLWGPPHHKHHILWSDFLDPRHGHITLVEADSGLVMLQHFTHRPVTLASYISGDYLRDVASADQRPEVVSRLGSRRYTPAVDSAIYQKVSHLLPDTQESIDVRYARDLRLDDLKQGNAILLGTHESTPWVELFENSMNFTFQNDLAAGTTAIVNRHPLAKEQAIYPMLPADPDHTVYGLVAYRPNLTHTGHVLIIEGETMAGTQSASEFLLDDAHLLPFLKSIQRRDGTIPHFEVLIRSSSLGGESSRIALVAFRSEAD
ncbi:hypothetical protein Terro_3799 [Terriglobus roseus DSM 18391]|uniref:Uncharacterized protein n=1 Tax=Terriglobus roseus (strain DSM 18391 / NRRL B-41598 / KBS 63) TaxID=926566 RepID=I3ZL90_TERRK|nr:hypothetical protein [Terriglobus roseus]AFL90008.1 hypothetical protein Terro_3799 [Terriglobus roseus DSM 18391]